MILTGVEIIKMVEQGRITLSPFDESRVQPNSYDLTLTDTLRRYDLQERRVGDSDYWALDPRKDTPTYDITIPSFGMVLMPGNLYLGCTNEVCGSSEFVPRLDGKSSLGRLGIKVHLTAGFVDLGFVGQLTLEIAVVQPVKVYPDMSIAQVSFTTTLGDRSIQYKGRYNNQQGPTPSRMHLPNPSDGSRPAWDDMADLG